MNRILILTIKIGCLLFLPGSICKADWFNEQINELLRNESYYGFYQVYRVPDIINEKSEEELSGPLIKIYSSGGEIGRSIATSIVWETFWKFPEHVDKFTPFIKSVEMKVPEEDSEMRVRMLSALYYHLKK